jgi:hypothetical protein
VLTRRSSGLDKLTDQLTATLAERDAAALRVEQAESAKEALDGLDAAAWSMAGADLAAATSEHERAEKAVATMYARCADAEEAAALVPVAKAEAELGKLDARIVEAEATVAALHAAREPVAITLEDAQTALADVHVQYLAPGSPEHTQHLQAERQRRELLSWHAQHDGSDHQLSRRDLAEVREIRARRIAESEQALERSVEQARADGTFAIEHTDDRIERIER